MLSDLSKQKYKNKTLEKASTTYLLINMVALDHKKSTASATIRQWQTSVRRWYSINSNRIHTAVAVPRTPSDIFLFLHKKTSAAVQNVPKLIHFLTKINQHNFINIHYGHPFTSTFSHDNLILTWNLLWNK